jgi:hypothetical protein
VLSSSSDKIEPHNKIVSMHLIQIVPGLPPDIDGIGDYALQLARRLRDGQGIDTIFLVCNPGWNGSHVEGFPVLRLTNQKSQSLVDAVAACYREIGSHTFAILLHFAPYGYQQRGYPLWFVRGLEEWERVQPRKLCVAFHELEVNSSNPWGSAFWIPGLQRTLIDRLARISIFSYTNSEAHRTKLEARGSGRVTLIPNFSTLGEPSTNPSFDKRDRNVIVFGRPEQRSTSYGRGRQALAVVCALVRAEKIIDIGKPIDGQTVADVDGIPIIRCGSLKAADVNSWMAVSMASFICYPVPLLMKSSVHAVSCAHGTIPFVFDDQKQELSCPGLVAGEDFIPVTLQATAQHFPISLEETSSNVFGGYKRRMSQEAAKAIAGHISAVVG